MPVYMKAIPIHNLGKEETLGFEVMPWDKDVNKYDASTPHRHSYYEILVFIKGGGVHEIDFIKYPIKSKSLHFVASNQIHEVRRKAGSNGFSLLFSQEFLPSNYNLKDFDFYQANTHPVLNLDSGNFKTIISLLLEVKQEFFANNTAKREVLRSLLQLILLKANRYYQDKKDIADKPNTEPEASIFKEKLQTAIEENYTNHWRASDYASHMNISVTQLNAYCKQHFSRSTESLIQEKLLIEIKRLLAYTTKPVKEICYELDFEDPAYFTRFFKKKTGLTPIEYRNAID